MFMIPVLKSRLVRAKIIVSFFCVLPVLSSLDGNAYLPAIAPTSYVQ